jgi:hypothetical protein
MIQRELSQENESDMNESFEKIINTMGRAEEK